MRIAIFGGTFNPIHMGHLVLAEEMAWKLGLDKVFFVPCYLPVHKTNRGLCAAPHRLKMVKMAIAGNKVFRVSRLEISGKDRSYSVNTVKKFRRLYGKKADIYFLAGSDSLTELSSWKNIDEILRLCRFVVARRPGYPLKRVSRRVKTIEITAVDVSSSHIRQLLKQRRSIRYLVPEKVRAYILKNRLYG